MMTRTAITYGNNANKEIKVENIVIAKVNKLSTYVIFGVDDADENEKR